MSGATPGRPTVEDALRYIENGKICEPYILLEVLGDEVKRLRAEKAAAPDLLAAAKATFDALDGRIHSNPALSALRDLSAAIARTDGRT